MGIGGWLVDGTWFVRYMESNGIKSAFPTEILLFKAPINKQHRCSSNDGDCWIKVLNEEAVKKGNMEMCFLRVFTI